MHEGIIAWKSALFWIWFLGFRSEELVPLALGSSLPGKELIITEIHKKAQVGFFGLGRGMP